MSEREKKKLIRRKKKADEKRKGETKIFFLFFSQIFNWSEPMKDFLLLFFSLSLFQPLEIKLIDDDGW